MVDLLTKASKVEHGDFVTAAVTERKAGQYVIESGMSYKIEDLLLYRNNDELIDVEFLIRDETTDLNWIPYNKFKEFLE